MFYSWPSRGSVEDYVYDQNSARQAQDTLQEFLELVKAKSDAEIVHLIGHSMGTNPLMEAVADMWKAEGADPTAPLFNQVILAAADIDRDVFFDLARQVKGAAEGFTLYASARDWALKFSRGIAGGIPRIGDVPSQGPAVYPDLDSIDATTLATEFFSLKHSEYADNRTLLDDIGLLLSQGLRPPNARTPSMRAIQTVDGVYWQYPR
jgi:esterase/lipase superfamily enzyme